MPTSPERHTHPAWPAARSARPGGRGVRDRPSDPDARDPGDPLLRPLRELLDADDPARRAGRARRGGGLPDAQRARPTTVANPCDRQRLRPDLRHRQPPTTWPASSPARRPGSSPTAAAAMQVRSWSRSTASDDGNLRVSTGSGSNVTVCAPRPPCSSLFLPIKARDDLPVGHDARRAGGQRWPDPARGRDSQPPSRTTTRTTVQRRTSCRANDHELPKGSAVKLSQRRMSAPSLGGLLATRQGSLMLAALCAICAAGVLVFALGRYKTNVTPQAAGRAPDLGARRHRRDHQGNDRHRDRQAEALQGRAGRGHGRSPPARSRTRRAQHRERRRRHPARPAAHVHRLLRARLGQPRAEQG